MAKSKDLETPTETPVLEVAKPTGNLVTVTVTKFGEGQVSTGVRVEDDVVLDSDGDKVGDVFAKRGDKLQVSKSVAASLEARGLAEMD